MRRPNAWNPSDSIIKNICPQKKKVNKTKKLFLFVLNSLLPKTEARIEASRIHFPGMKLSFSPLRELFFLTIPTCSLYSLKKYAKKQKKTNFPRYENEILRVLFRVVRITKTEKASL